MPQRTLIAEPAVRGADPDAAAWRAPAAELGAAA